MNKIKVEQFSFCSVTGGIMLLLGISNLMSNEKGKVKMATLLINRCSIILLFSLFVVGCATSSMTNSERTAAYNQYISSEKLEQLDYIQAFRFDGWNALGEEHLIISTNFNRRYLITLRQRCADLTFANVIKINNRDTTLQSKFDSITVPDSLGFKCYIKSIHKLNKQQRNALRQIGEAEETG